MALIYAQSPVSTSERVSSSLMQNGLSAISAKANASMIDTDCFLPCHRGSDVSWPASDGSCYVLMFPLSDLSVVDVMATCRNQVTAASSTISSAVSSSSSTVATCTSSSVCMASEVQPFISVVTENVMFVI